VFSFCLSTLYAQDPIRVEKVVGRPLIDGNLNDSIWQRLPHYTDFKTYAPEFGVQAKFRTTAMITYDEENLYMGFDCKDPEPAKLKATITARDQIKNEDWVCINFDPFFDQQSLICLYVNPMGIQMDSRCSSNQEDLGADYVFTSKAQINPDGYQIEIAIPFKSLRYPKRDPVTMGFIFERRIQRLSEHSTFPPLDPNQGMNFLTQTTAFSFAGIKHYTLVELLPSVTYTYKRTHTDGVFGLSVNKPAVGLTGTVGITSQLIMDVAVNPDFSQVESDAGQITENQRYALYYSEKRPFFQEGKGIFEISGSSESGYFRQAFHTRQIINPIAGIKLTGKISDHDRVGFLYALDDPDKETPGDSLRLWSHYAVGRVQHAFKDDSYLGVITTMREGSEQYNRVAGLDGRWRLTPSTAMEFNALGSATKSAPGSEHQADWMGTIKVSRSTSKLSGSFELQHIGTDFITQSGFLTRNGVTPMTLSLGYTFYRKSGFFRRIEPIFTGIINDDRLSRLWERDLSLGVSLMGERSTTLAFQINPCNEVYQNRRFRTDAIYLSALSQIIKQVRIQSSFRIGYRTRYVEDPFTGWGNTIQLNVNYQPHTKFQSDLNLSYSDFYRLEDAGKEFSYAILRSKNTFQLTSKLFIRGILEYNSFEKELTTDFLVSFTYIPGTVIHIGYGSLYEKSQWNGYEYQPGTKFLETIRGIFFKASYLWRN